MVEVITRLYAELAQSNIAQARIVFFLSLISIWPKVGKNRKSGKILFQKENRLPQY